MEKIELSDDKNKLKTVNDKNLVRTDSAIQKLDKFLNPSVQNENEDANKSISNRTLAQISTADRYIFDISAYFSLKYK